MRTMAAIVIFSVVVACSMQVFAIDCSRAIEDIRNCNDCIRCGGHWCINGEEEHCSSSKNDNWCPGPKNREELPTIKEDRRDGTSISPSYFSVSVAAGFESPRIKFEHSRSPSLGPNSKPEVELTVINSTQRNNFETAELKTTCDKSGLCSTYLSIKPTTDFCKDDGGKFEYLNMKLSVENLSEQAMVKYHVPCACSCSDHVERAAKICNGHGDFSCGVCMCHQGWLGEFCGTRHKCEDRRGDLQCTNPYKDHVTCSGNGICGECDKCICFEKGEGSQYFDPENFCADLPLIVTTECEACLHNLDVTEGQCPDCRAVIQPCNATLLQERDEEDRAVWVQFEDVDNEEYAVMKDFDSDLIYIMRKGFCKSIFNPLNKGEVNVTVPTILGILAVIAVVSAVAGYMVFKARAAPMPLNASQYQELDGPENSAGINPLYKPPTSSYNNPLWKGGAKV